MRNLFKRKNQRNDGIKLDTLQVDTGNLNRSKNQAMFWVFSKVVDKVYIPLHK